MWKQRGQTTQVRRKAWIACRRSRLRCRAPVVWGWSSHEASRLLLSPPKNRTRGVPTSVDTPKRKKQFPGRRGGEHQTDWLFLMLNGRKPGRDRLDDGGLAETASNSPAGPAGEWSAGPQHNSRGLWLPTSDLWTESCFDSRPTGLADETFAAGSDLGTIRRNDRSESAERPAEPRKKWQAERVRSCARGTPGLVCCRESCTERVRTPIRRTNFRHQAGSSRMGRGSTFTEKQARYGESSRLARSPTSSGSIVRRLPPQRTPRCRVLFIHNSGSRQ
jgi:hypothetical protein